MDDPFVISPFAELCHILFFMRKINIVSKTLRMVVVVEAVEVAVLMLVALMTAGTILVVMVPTVVIVGVAGEVIQVQITGFL